MLGRVSLLATLLAVATGCPTVDLGDNPPEPGVCRPDPVYFRDTILPQYIAPADMTRSCVGAAGCHRQSDGRSSLRLDIDPAAPAMADADASYNVVIRFLNCGSPEASSLLTKPLSGIDTHGGDDLFDTNSEPYNAFLAWFNQ